MLASSSSSVLQVEYSGTRRKVIIIKIEKGEGRIRSHGDDEVLYGEWRQSLTSGFVSWLILDPHPMISSLANRQRQGRAGCHHCHVNARKHCLCLC